MPAVLRPKLLHGVGMTLSGACAREVRERLTGLGAHEGDDVLVHGAELPTTADEARGQTAELVAFLASKAGAYYAGCAFTSR